MSQNPITAIEELQSYETTVGPVYQGGQKMSFEYVYDFAKSGGAIGAQFMTGRPMPKGFIITGASYLDVLAAVTSGGAATVSLGVETATDIRTAQTLATAPALSAIAVVDLTTNPNFAEETNFIKTTAVRRPLLTIASFALTAGKIVLILEGNISKS